MAPATPYTMAVDGSSTYTVHGSYISIQYGYSAQPQREEKLDARLYKQAMMHLFFNDLSKCMWNKRIIIFSLYFIIIKAQLDGLYI